MTSDDRRVIRTRLALQRAFTKLIFRDGFDAVSVGAIAAEANVGRSTFYKHFDGKEDVLKGGMSRFFRVFAESTVKETPPAKLHDVLEHLWENRRLGHAIFSPSPRAILRSALAEMIQEHLEQAASRSKPIAPLSLAAIQLAEAQIGVVAAWLTGEAECSAQVMALAFHASSYAAAHAWLSGTPQPQT